MWHWVGSASVEGPGGPQGRIRPNEPAPLEAERQAIGQGGRRHTTQGVFKTDERRALHRQGWTESFEKLGELVSERR
jgi:hypothetical protein